jgi:hypothetical protein
MSNPDFRWRETDQLAIVRGRFMLAVRMVFYDALRDRIHPQRA